jgi:hypothetical protein
MKKLLLIPLIFLLSGCYTVRSPSVGIRSNVRPGLEVYYDWYAPYPAVYFNPYFYYPRWNRVVHVNYYDFSTYYSTSWNRRPVTYTYKGTDYRGKDNSKGRSRNTVTRTTTRTRTTTTRNRPRTVERTSTETNKAPSNTRSARTRSTEIKRTSERRSPRKKNS